MRLAVTISVLLAVVSTAVVAVCQHSETRRLQYRVWQLERRRERLDRVRLRLSMAVEAGLTPRRLLREHDARQGAGGPAAASAPGFAPASPAGPAWVPAGLGPAFEPAPEGGR